jgi:hypothetical protein
VLFAPSCAVGNSEKPVLNMGQLTRDTWGIHGNFK